LHTAACDTPQSPREMILGPQCACVSRAVLYFPSLFSVSTLSAGVLSPKGFHCRNVLLFHHDSRVSFSFPYNAFSVRCRSTVRRAFIATMCSCFARAVEFRSLFLYNAFSVQCRSTFSEGLSLPQCAPVSLEQSSFVLFFCTMLFQYNAGAPSPKGFHCRNVLLFR
jgi:hypothetical protein